MDGNNGSDDESRLVQAMWELVHGDATTSKPSTRTDELAANLRGLIARDVYPSGTLLPSEAELISEHGVSRNTVRAAIRKLSDEGLVTPQHGRGVQVRPTPDVIFLGRELVEFNVSDAPSAESPEPPVAELRAAITTDPAETTAPPHIARRLDLPAHSSVMSDQTVHRMAGEVASLAHRYYLPGGDPTDGDILSDDVGARAPTLTESKLFQLPQGVPLLTVLQSVKVSGAPSPTAAIEWLIRADKYGIRYPRSLTRLIDPTDEG